MNPQFKIGQRVTRKAFTDCFQREQPEIHGTVMVVSQILTTVTRDPLPPCFRVVMEVDGKRGYVEAAELMVTAWQTPR